MVAHHHDGIVSEGISLQHLADALVVRTHATTNERYVACRNVVTALQSPFAIDVEDGLQAEVVVAQLDDVDFRRALRGHVTNNVSARGGDALVTGVVEVHQRVLNVRRLIARIVVGFP